MSSNYGKWTHVNNHVTRNKMNDINNQQRYFKMGVKKLLIKWSVKFNTSHNVWLHILYDLVVDQQYACITLSFMQLTGHKPAEVDTSQLGADICDSAKMEFFFHFQSNIHYDINYSLGRNKTVVFPKWNIYYWRIVWSCSLCFILNGNFYCYIRLIFFFESKQKTTLKNKLPNI